MSFSSYPIDEVLKRSQSPSVEIRAVVSYDERDLAKARRFGWDAARKLWVKQVKECDLDREIEAAQFRIEVTA